MQNHNAIRPLHGARVIEEDDEIQRLLRIATARGSLDRETNDIAIVGKRITGAFPGKSQSRSRRGRGIVIVESIDELLDADETGIGNDVVLQTGGSELERNIADIQRKGGESIITRADFRLGRGRWSSRFFDRGIDLVSVALA